MTLKTTLVAFFCCISFVIQAQFVDGQLFVKLISKSDYTQIEAELKVLDAELTDPITIGYNGLDRVFVVEYSGEWGNVYQTLEANDLVEYVERVPDYQAFYTPNDLHTSQWNLTQIFAEQAWDETIGNNRIIAMVDDAILLSHEDLSANIWTNPGEIPGNGIDDDANGYIDDVNGWDAADGDNDPNPPATASSACFSHGSHCAGIAAAVTDNSLGIASIGFNSQIMAVKIGTGACSSLANAYLGVNYAIASGAHIINMSWGGGVYSITYQTIFDAAYASNIVCVAAAVNSSTSLPMYPASYNHVISVGSTTTGDVISGFSNYGSTIDVMAPGSNIYSCLGDGVSNYGTKNGTSMACPLVSGLISLMLSKDTLQTVDEIEACLESTCDPIDAVNPGLSGMLGSGRINALHAIECIKPISAAFISDYKDVCIGSTVNFTDLSSNSPTGWIWDFPGGSPTSSTIQNPIITYSAAGTYDVQLIASNSDGADTLLMPGYITVDTPTATIGGGGTMLYGYSSFIRFDFTGAAPWDVSYTEGITTYNLTGITSNPYFHPVSPDSSATYSIVAFSSALCTGTGSGSAFVEVIAAGACEKSCFTKFYDAPMEEEVHGITLLSDGGYVIVGLTTSFSSGAEDLLIERLDPCGNIIWSKSFGSPGEDVGVGVIQDDDGSIVVTGRTSFGGGIWDYYLLKIDLAGTLIYSYHYGQTSFDYPRGIVAGVVDGYTMAGVTGSPSVGGNEICVFHVDDAGNVSWRKVFGTPTGNDFLHDIIRTSDGNYLATGYRRNAISNYEGWIVKFDPNGDIIWANLYNAAGDEAYFDVIEVSDGYLALGYSTTSSFGGQDLILTKVDFGGNIFWTKTYGGAGAEISCGLAELSDGRLVASTRTTSYTAEDGLLILLLDSNGTLLSTDLVDGPGDETSGAAGKQIVINSSDNIAIIGYTNSFTTSSLFNPLLLRSDTLQQFSCSTIPVTIDTNSITLIQSTYPLLESIASYTKTTPTTVEQIANLVDSTECSCTSFSTTPCGILVDFNSVSGCITDSVFFTDLSNDTSGTIIDWIWEFGDGNMAGGIQNPHHLYSSPGTYHVQLFVINDIGCIDSITQSVIVTTGFNISAIPDTTICEFDSLQVLFNPGCGTPPYVITWSSTIGVQNTNALSTSISPPSTTTYTVLVTDALGFTASTTFTIIVNTGCCTSHAVIDSVSYACVNDSIFISQNSLINGAPHTHEWLFPGGTPVSFTGDIPPMIAYGASGSYAVSLILNDGCGTDTSTQTINVFPPPLITVRSDTAICEGDTVHLGAGPIGFQIYSWTPVSGLSDATIANPVANITASSDYTLTVTDQLTGCSSSDVVAIIVENCDSCDLEIPNVFTPNGDGKNDFFVIVDLTGNCIIKNTTIYNRWGQVLFISELPDPIWDGRNLSGELVPDGTYYCVVENETGTRSSFVHLTR